MKTPKKSSYTAKEIAAALNNAVLQTGGAKSITEASCTRLAVLRDHTWTLYEILAEHAEAQNLTWEELVYIVTATACFINTIKVSKKVSTNDIAVLAIMRDMITDTKEPEDGLQT